MQGTHRLIKRRIEIARTPRVMQLEGLFDVPQTETAELSWQVDLPLDERAWNIGLIVGPSGCGKSTIAREVFGDAVIGEQAWPGFGSVLDGFPTDLGIKDITLLLASVGFASPPAWMRPFHVLSTGEQFRVSMARALAEHRDLAVVDEFTSVVDRTVAKIGSAAIAKTVRKRGGQFVAVTCHYDVEEWLDPDWVYDPSIGAFHWRALRGRPPIELSIRRCHHSEWRRFAGHHYLTADLNTSSACFLTSYQGRPCAFHAWLAFIGRLRDSRKAVRAHRIVCLPDFQGVGIAAAVTTHLARMYRAFNTRVLLTSGHPSIIASMVRDGWRMTRPPSRSALDTSALGAARLSRTRASRRLTASFEFGGEPLPIESALAQFGRNRPEAERTGAGDRPAQRDHAIEHEVEATLDGPL